MKQFGDFASLTLLSPLFYDQTFWSPSMPSCISNFSTPIFNHTSLNILNVLLMSLWLPPAFAALSGSSDHVLLYRVFASLGCATSSSFLFWHLYHLCLSLITLCPLLSPTWHPFSPYFSHSMYVTITSFVYYPNSSRHALSGMPSPQCSCAFRCRTYTRLLLYAPSLSCCASCGLVTYATSFSFTLLTLLSLWCTFPLTRCATLFTSSHNRHSLHLCPFSPYL